MKNYFKEISDDQIKSIILDYLKLTGWKDELLNLDNIDDIRIVRNKDFGIMTLYFYSPDKKKPHVMSVLSEIDTHELRVQRVFQTFFFDAFQVVGFNLENSQTKKLLYGEPNIEDDFKLYWMNRMSKIFGMSYFQNLKEYNMKGLNQEFDEKVEKLIKKLNIKLNKQKLNQEITF